MKKNKRRTRIEMIGGHGFFICKDEYINGEWVEVEDMWLRWQDAIRIVNLLFDYAKEDNYEKIYPERR